MNKKLSALELLHEGARFISSEEYQKAVSYLEKALNENARLEVIRLIYQHLGKAYFHLNNLEKAFEYQKNDCVLSRKLGDEASEICSRDNLIYTLKKMDRFDDAIKCCRQYIQLSENAGNKGVMARAYYGMANVHHMKAKKQINTPPVGLNGDQNIIDTLNTALLFYQKNLEVLDELNDDVEKGRTSGMIGNAYYLLEDGHSAEPFYLKRLGIAKQYGDKAAVLRTDINLGHNCILLSQYQRAIEFYLQALSLSRQLNDITAEGQTCYTIGSTYAIMENYSEAIEHYKRHKEIALKLDDKIGLCCSLGLLSKTYKKNGDRKLAEECARNQMHVAKETANPDMMMKAQKNFADICGPTNHNFSDDASNGDTTLQPNGNDEKDMNGPPTDIFFDFLTRMQGRRLNDQRVDTGLPQDDAVANANDEENQQRMNRMIQMLSCSQSKRLDEQRVSLTSLPGFQRHNNHHSNHQVSNPPSSSNGDHENGDDVDDNDVTIAGLDNDFLDNLMRAQNLRMDDQRTDAGQIMTSPTIPDDEFLALMCKVQSQRIDDQRCNFEPPAQ